MSSIRWKEHTCTGVAECLLPRVHRDNGCLIMNYYLPSGLSRVPNACTGTTTTTWNVKSDALRRNNIITFVQKHRCTAAAHRISYWETFATSSSRNNNGRSDLLNVVRARYLSCGHDVTLRAGRSSPAAGVYYDNILLYLWYCPLARRKHTLTHKYCDTANMEIYFFDPQNRRVSPRTVSRERVYARCIIYGSMAIVLVVRFIREIQTMAFMMINGFGRVRTIQFEVITTTNINK